MEKAYQDEAAWNSAVKETRKRDPVACGDLLRYGSVVKTWSKDPEKDLREAIRLFDKAMALADGVVALPAGAGAGTGEQVEVDLL